MSDCVCGSDSKDAHSFCGTSEYLASEKSTNLDHAMAVEWWALSRSLSILQIIQAALLLIHQWVQIQKIKES